MAKKSEGSVTASELLLEMVPLSMDHLPELIHHLRDATKPDHPILLILDVAQKAGWSGTEDLIRVIGSGGDPSQLLRGAGEFCNLRPDLLSLCFAQIFGDKYDECVEFAEHDSGDEPAKPEEVDFSEYEVADDMKRHLQIAEVDGKTDLLMSPELVLSLLASSAAGRFRGGDRVDARHKLNSVMKQLASMSYERLVFLRVALVADPSSRKSIQEIERLASVIGRNGLSKILFAAEAQAC